MFITFKGYFTLMCGDGTNDVGALKHAHIGVSILSNSETKKKKPKIDMLTSSLSAAPAGGNSGIQNRVRGANERTNIGAMTARERAIAKHREQSQAILDKALKDIEDEQVQIVKLGDASIAAPFTSKSSSINCGML